MWARVGLVVGLVTMCVSGVGVARAAGTYKLCSGGAGKPLLSPGHSNRCGKGKKAIVLANSGAVTSLTTELKGLQGQNQSLLGRVTTLEGEVATLNGQVSTLNGQVATLDGQVSTVNGQVSTLNPEVSSLQSLLVGVSRSGSTLQFSGMNLQVLSGSGSTDGPVNGLGNLIIGYNKQPGSQTGSNNLVLGEGQTFTSYGGIIAGQNNVLSGPFADVFGDGNRASANSASVLGGENNDATGSTSSILGGNGVSVSTADGTAPTGVIGSVTGSVGFSLGANACGAFTVGDSALHPGDVPLFAYTTTPPSENVVFTPGAVTSAGQAKFTACNLSSSSTTFSGAIHLVAFRG